MSALRLPMGPNLIKNLKGALTGYDTALRVRDNESQNLTRAHDIANKARKLAAEQTADRYQAGKIQSVPLEIVKRVVETESDETYAALALEIATRAINVNADRPETVLRSWGPEGTKWAATMRARVGQNGNVDELTRYVFKICCGTYRVPGECFDGYNEMHIMNADVYLKTVDNVLPAPVGPTADNHPQRRGKRNKITMNIDEPTADELRYWDTARHTRLVQYWACCAIAAGEAQLSGGAWRVTADWQTRHVLFDMYKTASSNSEQTTATVNVNA